MSKSQYNIDYDSVKKPTDDQALTEAEVFEWQKCKKDFWYFATKYCYVVGPKGKVLFEPREYQVTSIDYIINNRFVIINSPR